MSVLRSLFFAPAPPEGETTAYRWWGIVAIGCYAAHAGFFISVGRPSNLLWGCHMAALGVGTGLLLRIPLFNAMGMLSLIFGVPLWLLSVATGGEFLPTSMLTHLGGFVLGLYGVWKMGLPRQTCFILWVVTCFLIALSRAVSPLTENVNLAYGAPPGWDWMPGWPLFGLIVLGGAASQFALGQIILRRVFRTRLARLEGAPPPE